MRKPHAGIDRSNLSVTSPSAPLVSRKHPAGGYRECTRSLDDQCRHTVADASSTHLAHVVFARGAGGAAVRSAVLGGPQPLFRRSPVCKYVRGSIRKGQRKDRVAASVWQGVYFSPGRRRLAHWPSDRSEFLCFTIGHEGKIAALEGEYFIGFASGIPALLTATLSCFFSGRGQTLTVSLVNISGVLLNALLDYCMIFGWGPFPE